MFHKTSSTKIPEEFKDALTQELMNDPVMIKYNDKVITVDRQSDVMRLVKPDEVVENHKLKERIAKWKEKQPKPAESAATVPTAPKPRRNHTEYDYLFKCVVIGDSNVGKSSLILRFADNTFTESFINTIGMDFKVRDLELDGTRIKLQIYDSAGQDRFRDMTRGFSSFQAVILAIDLTNLETLNNASTWIQRIYETKKDRAPIIIFGTKSDLTQERLISDTVLQQFADTCKLPCIITSAKKGTNVEDAFRLTSEKIMGSLLDHDMMNEYRRRIKKYIIPQFLKSAPNSERYQQLDDILSRSISCDTIDEMKSLVAELKKIPGAKRSIFQSAIAGTTPPEAVSLDTLFDPDNKLKPR